MPSSVRPSWGAFAEDPSLAETNHLSLEIEPVDLCALVAIAKELAELHGGSVTAENREEGGARFTSTPPTGPHASRRLGVPRGRRSARKAARPHNVHARADGARPDEPSRGVRSAGALVGRGRRATSDGRGVAERRRQPFETKRLAAVIGDCNPDPPAPAAEGHRAVVPKGHSDPRTFGVGQFGRG
jgi:hypothetical protein